MNRIRIAAIGVVVLGIMLAVMVGSLQSDIERTQALEHQTLIDESIARTKQSLVKYFKSDQESQILDAAWASESMFTVGVKDNGSKRDRLAKYVCRTLMDDLFNEPEFAVQVIDFNQLTDNQALIVLGEVSCE